jgi:hypothetical protein
MRSNVYLLRILVSKLDKYDLFSLNVVLYCTVPIRGLSEAPDSMITQLNSLHFNILFHSKDGILGIRSIHLILSIIHLRSIWLG